MYPTEGYKDIYDGPNWLKVHKSEGRIYIEYCNRIALSEAQFRGFLAWLKRDLGTLYRRHPLDPEPVPFTQICWEKDATRVPKAAIFFAAYDHCVFYLQDVERLVKEGEKLLAE